MASIGNAAQDVMRVVFGVSAALVVASCNQPDETDRASVRADGHDQLVKARRAILSCSRFSGVTVAAAQGHGPVAYDGTELAAPPLEEARERAVSACAESETILREIDAPESCVVWQRLMAEALSEQTGMARQARSSCFAWDPVLATRFRDADQP